MSYSTLVLQNYFVFPGLVNTFLSWKGFSVLGRLSYSAYLGHAITMSAYIFSVKNPVTFSHYFVVSSGL